MRKRAVEGDTKVFVPSPHKEPLDRGLLEPPDDTWPQLETNPSLSHPLPEHMVRAFL